MTVKNISRVLRKNQTPWEAKLWSVLRNRNIKDLKFRRQFKVGNYIVDFCCPSKKLVVELDGGHHSEEEVRSHDKKKQGYLEKQGYKIVRFWNNEIDDNLDGVVLKIVQSLSPHPTPLPSGRGQPK